MNDDRLIYYPILPPEEDTGAERSADVRAWVRDYLLPSGVVTENPDKANAFLVATGDGGFMHACRQYYQSKKVFFGINRGRLGFLLNPISDISQIPTHLSELNQIAVNLIKVTFTDQQGREIEHLAFNDIFCGSDIADYNTFTIRGSLSHFPNRRVNGNGIIIATAQGTTAYALKSKGSAIVLPLDSNSWAVAGVATGAYPCDIVSPQTIVIDIDSRTAVNGYADGRLQTVANVRRVKVEPTDKTVTLGFLKTIDFAALRTSLVQKEERGENGIS
ncbi:MAG: hypothetical protein NUV82_01645 [Candidatus Komeilibacteria bacterium]|nr:hypothetical protein [Candidatus Komeilibacteria bacterium]